MEYLLRHVDGVRLNTRILGQRLMEGGEEELGLALIASGNVHDQSKFSGEEWECLNDNLWPYPDGEKKERFLSALRLHVTTNPHHPEYWGGIHEMEPWALAECCCDWAERSSEQGTSIWDWATGRARERFKFSRNSRVAREIRRFLTLLLERKFSG